MEEKLAKKIKQLIENDSNGITEVPMATFAKKWGKGTMPRLMQFTKENGLGYISVVRGNRIMTVRFWKIKEKHLLEEPDEVA